MHTSIMILHSEDLASVNSRTTLKEREMVDDTLLGVADSGKVAGHAHPWTHTQRKGAGLTSNNSEWMYVYTF